MARLCAVANGNNTSASTWALIDSTSFVEIEGTATTVPTTYATSYTQFTPGAITIDAIAFRLGSRLGTSGTFSIELYNHTAGASVAGTEVTINCSDFVDATSALIDGGWQLFKFSPVTLLAANAYSVRFKTSSSSQITYYRGGTSNDPSRFVRTTTTQAPVAGDDRFVMREWTAAGTSTTKTVTLDDTSVVDYGSASTSLITPALSISDGGIVLAGTSASTTYVQKLSGTIVIYNGGVLRLGTSSGRMPTTSSFTLTMDCVSNVDFGIVVRKKGEFTAYGEQKQRWTLLTADKSATNTVISVASTSGWKANDTLLFSATGTTITHGETKSISTVDSSTQVTLSAGLTNAHTGTGDVIGEVGNITSNVNIVGTSTTVGTYLYFDGGALVNIDNITVQYFGSASTSKRGVEIASVNTSVNSTTINSCVFRDYSNSSAYVGSVNTSGAFFTITNNVCYHSQNTGLSGALIIVAGLSGTPTFSVLDNLCIGLNNNGTGFQITAVTGTSGILSGNRIAGFSTGLSITTSYLLDSVTNISDFKIHSCSTGIGGTPSVQKKTLTNCDIVCNSTGVSSMAGDSSLIGCNFIGNSVNGLAPTNNTNNSSMHLYAENCVFRGRTGFNQTVGFQYGSTSEQGCTRATFNNCSFGQTVAHVTADVYANNAAMTTQIYFNNCTFASTTEIGNNVHLYLLDQSVIGVQRGDTTAGNHTLYVKQGIITRDTTIYKTASPSIRITPKSATITCSNKLFPFRVPVNSGQTCTPTIYVRESESGDGAAYNGNRVKLYVKANYNLGITSDTLLDTATSASDGAWEGLTGTTSAVTDDGVLEFYIVADGTTGWINVDDCSATVA